MRGKRTCLFMFKNVNYLSDVPVLSDPFEKGSGRLQIRDPVRQAKGKQQG